MNRNRTQIFIIASLFLTLSAIIVVLSLNQNKTNWKLSYHPEDSNPYGTKILFDLLQNVRKGQPFVLIKDSTHKNLPIQPSDKKDSYVFIGNNYYADSSDIAALLHFVSNGNNAIIICANHDHRLLDTLSKVIYEDDLDLEGNEELEDTNEYAEMSPVVFPDQRMYSVMDTSITLHLATNDNNVHPSAISYQYNFEPILNQWSYFSDALLTFDNRPFDIYGSFDENYVNFIGMKYGSGEIYFHSSPIVFTNLYMLEDTAMAYCRSSLAFMGDGSIYWDEENRDYHHLTSNQNSAFSHNKPQEGPLEFILSEPALQKAWYLLIFTTILYLVFGAKRKQRVIKSVSHPENTSIEYAEVLSRMFLKQKDHKKLILMKMELYKAFVRDRFNIRLPTHMRDENEILYTEISQRSGVSFAITKSIFEGHKYLSSIVIVGTSEMVQFHKQLEAFYKTCK